MWYKKKGGGGFLSGQAGVVESYKIDSTTFGENTKMSVELNLRIDGRDEPAVQFLDAGFIYEGQTISDDGLTLEGGAQVQEGSEFFQFVQSIIENDGVSEDELGDGTNFEAILGWRYEFGRAINVDKQMAKGRKALSIKDKKGFTGKNGTVYTAEQVMEAGKRKDPNDKTKSYNEDFLVVAKVLGKAEAAAPAVKGKKTAAAAKPVAAKKAPAADDSTETADNLLVELLADAKKPIKKSGLSSLVVRKALSSDMDDATRDAIRKLYGSDEYLGRNNGWAFDGKEVVLG